MLRLKTTLLISLIFFMGCKAHTGINHASFSNVKKAWWGDTRQVKEYLDTPEAQGVKVWYLEALE